MRFIFLNEIDKILLKDFLLFTQTIDICFTLVLISDSKGIGKVTLIFTELTQWTRTSFRTSYLNWIWICTIIPYSYTNRIFSLFLVLETWDSYFQHPASYSSQTYNPLPSHPNPSSPQAITFHIVSVYITCIIMCRIFQDDILMTF